MLVWPVPSAFITYISELPSRKDSKAILLPSLDRWKLARYVPILALGRGGPDCDGGKGVAKARATAINIQHHGGSP